MIPGFENFTADVTDDEIHLINKIADALNRRIGPSQAITNTEAREGIYKVLGINVGDPKFRKYIQYIRAYNLCPMLCASSKGYYIARNEEEFIKYRDGYASRVRSMQFTLASMYHYHPKTNVIN